ncbi:hypothetical protein OK016_01495 [Vibrio chagasii]|nr:hypothetical protein [Vibrio chagasii]
MFVTQNQQYWLVYLCTRSIQQRSHQRDELLTANALSCSQFSSNPTSRVEATPNDIIR